MTGAVGIAPLVNVSVTGLDAGRHVRSTLTTPSVNATNMLLVFAHLVDTIPASESSKNIVDNFNRN